MIARSLFIVLFLLSLIACGKTPAPTGSAVSSSPRPDAQIVEASSQEHAQEHGDEKAKDEHKDPSQEQFLQLNPDALRDLRLTTRKAEKRPAGDTVTTFGSLELNPNAIRSLSTPIAARVLSISKLLGEKVEAGDALAELESLDLGRSRLTAEAAKSRTGIAKTRVELAQKQKERLQELATAKMATVREIQTAEAELAARAAELAESELQLRESEQALALLPNAEGTTGGRFLLRAANPGTVIFRDGSPGESVEAGHVFLRVADLSTVIAVAHPFERDGLRIDAAASALIYPAAHPGKSFEAKFLLAGPEVDSLSRTLPVRFEVRNPEGRLLPGMSVTAEIRLAPTAEQEIVTVPIAAVQRIERDWCVFLPKGRGKFERRVVARGRDLGGEVEILSGLSPGEEVVVEGAFVLRSEATRGEDTGDEHDH